MQRDEIASVVVLTMKAVLAPVQERLAKCETRLEEKESKGFAAGTDFAIRKELTTICERIAVLETRPLLPGPPGVDGAPGRDGEPGPPGTPGLDYRDVYQAGQHYDRGDCVTYAGSMWHCNQPTEARPGDGSAAWTLMVKRGRDAKGAA